MKKLVLFFIFLFVVSLVFGAVFMTEIADPNNNANARYIEFYNNGASAVDFTEGSGWRINKYTNGSLTVSSFVDLTGTIAASDFYILAYDVTSGEFLTVYGFAADQLDSVSNGTAGGNGDDTLELLDGTGAVVDFYGVQPHDDFTSSVWEFEDGRAERANGATSGTNPPADADWNTWSDGSGGDIVDPQDAPGDFDPGSWIGEPTGGPTITVIPTSLTGFTYVFGSGPSTEQTFTAEGSDLTADITITAPTNYEISETSGSGYTSPITLTQTAGVVTTTTIYTRLIAGLSIGGYNGEDITASSAGATSKTVTCSGTVTGLEPTNHVDSFIATADGFQKIDLAWLANDGVVPPVGYLIKASTTTTITDPVDGIPEDDYSIIGDDSGAKNIAHGTNVFEWTWLDPETIYYFNIYPYTNSGVDINYKTDGVIPSYNATTGVQPATPDVFFSEYIEGSSNNKALEIFNASGSTIDLADFALWRISNGGDWEEGSTSNAVFPVGTVADGETWVICNSASDALIQAVADSIGSTITYYNGNDAVGLGYLGIPGELILIDAVGEDGPDFYWDVAGTTGATGEHTLVRKSSVTTGNTDWAASAGTDVTDSEWIVYPVDTFSYLGAHSMGNSLPLIANIVRNPAGDVTSSTTVSVSADITDFDGTIGLVELHWGLTSGSLGNTINMSTSERATYTTDSDIPAQSAGTTIYYEVEATDDEPESSTSAEQSYSVWPASTTLTYEEPFDAALGICYTYSDSGATKEWYWNTGGYAYMSGYNSGDTEEDWLILPAIDLDSYANETMTFDTWYNYGTDNADNYLKLYYSADYPGLGDPSGYSWTELPFDHPTGSSTWTPSGSIDLSAVTGTSVYIAFKYRYEAGLYRNWGVDNLSISESVVLDPPTNVVITEDGVNVTISWDVVGGLTYTIYSDVDPYGAFGSTEETGNTTGTYSELLGTKKFYKVTANN